MRNAPPPAGARKALGQRGEDLAAERLAAAGWDVVARNWRPHGRERRGEIDLIARDHEFLVFVEVRTRRQGRGGGAPAFGRAEESVTPRKQLQLVQLAVTYLYDFPWAGPWRIDIVAIELDGEDHIARFAHFRDAVGG